jgi:hypothetical protein
MGPGGISPVEVGLRQSGMASRKNIAVTDPLLERRDGLVEQPQIAVENSQIVAEAGEMRVLRQSAGVGLDRLADGL